MDLTYGEIAQGGGPYAHDRSNAIISDAQLGETAVFVEEQSP